MNHTKGAIHYVILLLIIILSSSLNIVSGWKGNQFSSSVILPVKKIVSTVGEIFNPKPTPTALQNNRFSPQIDYSSTASTESNLTVLITPTPTHKTLVPSPTFMPQKNEVVPTISYPTIAPGQPGSKEWNDEFWKKWNEMSRQNKDLQQTVEEAQKKFCQENPTLCN